MTTTVRGARPSRLSRSTQIMGGLFVAPYLVFLLAFSVLPILLAIVESFTDSRSGTGAFGLNNWGYVFGDFRFWPAVQHVGLFMLAWIPFMTVATILVALLVHEKVGRSTSVLRMAYILPGVAAGVAGVLLWYFMLTPQVSPFGPILRAAGFNSVQEIFQDPLLPVMFALMMFATGAGGWIVILFGALNSIPTELMEASRIDGAGPIRTAIYVKIPMIRKYVYYMVVLSFAAATQIFMEPLLIYRTVIGSSSPWWSLMQLTTVFGFDQGDLGSASVLALLLTIIALAAAVVIVRFTDFFETEVDK